MANDFIVRKSIETGVKEEHLESIWQDAINEVMETAKTAEEKDESKKVFWKKVKEVFNRKVDQLNIEEARLIMDNRNKYQETSQEFLDAIQNDNYVKAKEVFPNVIEAKVNNIINTLKDGYLKNMAANKNGE